MTAPDPKDVDRPRGGLTPADRRYLTGMTEYASDQSERDARYRIRKRFRNAVLDIRLAGATLERRDFDHATESLTVADAEMLERVAEYIRLREKLDSMTTAIDDINTELENTE